MSRYKLNAYEATLLSEEEGGAQYFESLTTNRDPAKAINWIINEVFGYIRKQQISMNECPVSSEELGKMMDLVEQHKISGKIVKRVLYAKFVANDQRPAEQIIQDNQWYQLEDTENIEILCQKLIEQNPKEVSKVLKGSDGVLQQFFVGRVLKETKGRAPPQFVTDYFKKLFADLRNKKQQE